MAVVSLVVMGILQGDLRFANTSKSTDADGLCECHRALKGQVVIQLLQKLLTPSEVGSARGVGHIVRGPHDANAGMALLAFVMAYGLRGHFMARGETGDRRNHLHRLLIRKRERIGWHFGVGWGWLSVVGLVALDTADLLPALGPCSCDLIAVFLGHTVGLEEPHYRVEILFAQSVFTSHIFAYGASVDMEKGGQVFTRFATRIKTHLYGPMKSGQLLGRPLLW